MAESAAYARRGYSGAAAATTLSSGIGTGDTTVPCTSLATWSSTHSNGAATAIITEGTTVEIVEFTGISGNSLTGVTRGVGGTTAAAFSAGATVEHGSRDRDFNEANYTTAETVGKVTTAGDILVADGANSLDRLAIGTARQNLSVNAGATALTYSASMQSLMTATGDIVYASGANTPARLAAGTDGHVLKLASGVPTWAAVTATSIGDLLDMQFGRVTANQTVSASTTLVNATNLGVTIGANEIWTIKFVLFVGVNSNADMKLALDVPASVDAVRLGVAQGLAATATADTGDAQTTFASTDAGTVVVGGTDTSSAMVILEGYVDNGANAGTAQLQFACNVATETATIQSSSYYIAQRWA